MSDHDQLVLEGDLCKCDRCRVARDTFQLAVQLGDHSRALLTANHREMQLIRDKLAGAEARAQAAEQKLLAAEKGPSLAERLATGAAETSKALPYSKE